MIEETYIEINEQYKEGVAMDEYNEKYSICAANQGANGKIYSRWMFPQIKDREPSTKSLPWQVTLGSRSQAIKTLEYFLKVLKGSNVGDFEQEYKPPDNAQPAVNEEDIPF